MRKRWTWILCGLAFVTATLVSELQDVQARPQYLTVFKRVYPDHAEAKCAICHAGETKKVRNEYGKAVGDALGTTGVKDEVAIEAALKKAEEKKPRKP